MVTSLEEIRKPGVVRSPPRRISPYFLHRLHLWPPGKMKINGGDWKWGARKHRIPPQIQAPSPLRQEGNHTRVKTGCPVSFVLPCDLIIRWFRGKLTTLPHLFSLFFFLSLKLHFIFLPGAWQKQLYMYLILCIYKKSLIYVCLF